MIVKRAIAHSSVVGGGGAIELELSRFDMLPTPQILSSFNTNIVIGVE
jgi:hypothetical protein